MNTCLTLFAIAILLHKGASHSHDHSHSHGHGHNDHRSLEEGVETCGFQDPDPETLAEDAKSFALWKSAQPSARISGVAKPEYTIPVYIHIIAPGQNTMAVSYTHLTLPTICSV